MKQHKSKRLKNDKNRFTENDCEDNITWSKKFLQFGVDCIEEQDIKYRKGEVKV